MNEKIGYAVDLSGRASSLDSTVGGLCRWRSTERKYGLWNCIEISDFLGSGKRGPEHQSLLRLIGELAVTL